MSKYKPIPPKRKKGTSVAISPAVKTLQAQSMFEMRVKGHTVEEVAKAHRVGMATVYRRMNWAEENGIVEELQARVRREIAPLALDAYEATLKQTTAYTPDMLETQKLKLSAAKDIAFGSNVLTKDTQKGKADLEVHSLAWYHEQSKKEGQIEHASGTSEVAFAVHQPELLSAGAEGDSFVDGEVSLQGQGDDRGVVEGDAEGDREVEVGG